MTDAALRVLAPTAEEMLLLRACVPAGAQGRAAFEEWTARVGDPVRALRQAPPSVSALLPVLLHATEANGTRTERSLTKLMRAAWTHEEARGQRFEAACRDVLSALDEPAIALPGVGLVATVYREWPLRHCHDLDLLVRGGEGRTVHPSGMPVVRHTGLGGGPWFSPPVEDAWARASSATVGGVRVPVLCDADALAHVCVHAASRVDRPGPRWALDAWWIMTHGNVDWRTVLGLATPRLAPILSAQLGWLSEELFAPVPGSVLSDLRRAARAADRLSVELALFLARRRVGAAHLVRRAGRDRPDVIRATLAPSSDYLDLWGVRRREWMRRGAAKLLKTRRAVSAGRRSRREWSPGRARRAAETPAHPPRAR